MKIVRARAEHIRIPMDEPLGGFDPKRMRSFVALTLECDDGTDGIALTTHGAALSGALHQAVDALAQLAIGEDPLRIEFIVRKLRLAGDVAGPAGIFTLALAAVDIALWDIKAKAANLPLWKYLGGAQDRVPTYASGALMRLFPPERAPGVAARLVEKGFRDIKMQLALTGETSSAREVAHARAVRDAVGPDVRLTCDINQLWRVEQAIDMGRRLEDAGIDFGWLEDVTAAEDFQGLARIADALRTPIAGGEYLWGLPPFRQMVEQRSVDIVMPDLLHIGGITPWLKCASLAEAFNLPIVSHLLPEVHVHLIAAIPNGLTVEYMPWTNRFFEEIPVPQRGYLSLPTAPGLGLKFDRAFLDRYRVG